MEKPPGSTVVKLLFERVREVVSDGSRSRMESMEMGWMRSLQSVWFALQVHADGQLVVIPHKLRMVNRPVRSYFKRTLGYLVTPFVI